MVITPGNVKRGTIDCVFLIDTDRIDFRHAIVALIC